VVHSPNEYEAELLAALALQLADVLRAEMAAFRRHIAEWPNVWLQVLELLVTLLLAQNRQPPPTVAAGVPHAEFAAKLISLPSGLLAMVCDAIVKLKVRLGAAAAALAAAASNILCRFPRSSRE
jgi:hypothetical protein